MQELRLPYARQIDTPFPLINAVLANIQDGKIFELENEIELFYIINKAGFSYITKRDAVDYSVVLNFLLYSKDIPDYFHLYDPPAQFIELCSKKIEEVNIKNRRRIQLKFRNPKTKFEELLAGKNTITPITENNFKTLSIFNLSLESKFWKSEEDFEKNSFGYCVFNEKDLPVSICYAACVVNNTAEIDVATLPEYKKKGYAKLAVTAFVEHCCSHGITANWDCFEENISSLKTAESIGFDYIMTYNFLSVFNKRKNHETH